MGDRAREIADGAWRSMNAGRYTPLPESERALVDAVAREVEKYEADLRELADDDRGGPDE